MSSTVFNVANPMIYNLLKENAKHNRQYATEAEHVLWELLRKKQLGVVFKRQYIIDEYIVDFVCLSQKLIIEVNGEYHSMKEQQEQDKMREQRLRNMGYCILRFTNSEVMVSPNSVVDTIKQSLASC